jgi:cellulose biosynthesis protein BcsQ
MPQTIALVSQTGNVMKTTIAAALGLNLAAAGLSITAIDLDPEHRARGASLSTWLAERKDRHPSRTQLHVETPNTAKEALDLIERSLADIVILDCPSRATEATFLIARESDFTVLPLVPGDKDATLTKATLEQLLQTGIDPRRLAVILTRFGSSSEARDYRTWLEALNLGPITYLQSHIPERIGYRNALTRRLAITEAQPASVRRAARLAIDELIEAFDAATTVSQPAPSASIQGAA